MYFYCIKKKALNSDVSYTVFNDNDKSVISKTGKELAAGIKLEIKEFPGSLLLKYHKKQE